VFICGVPNSHPDRKPGVTHVIASTLLHFRRSTTEKEDKEVLTKMSHQSVASSSSVPRRRLLKFCALKPTLFAALFVQSATFSGYESLGSYGGEDCGMVLMGFDAV
jgi:hypothetical protein